MISRTPIGLGAKPLEARVFQPVSRESGKPKTETGAAKGPRRSAPSVDHLQPHEHLQFVQVHVPPSQQVQPGSQPPQEHEADAGAGRAPKKKAAAIIDRNALR